MNTTMSRMNQISSSQVTLNPAIYVAPPKHYHHREIEVSLPELRVKMDGKEIYLSLAEMRLLLVLMDRPYEQISTGELVRRIDLTDSRSLCTLIHALRKHLDQRYIHTCRGYGYQFDRDDHS